MTYIVGDSRQLLKEFSPNQYDLVYIDPPYNTGRNWFNFDDRFSSPTDYIDNLIKPLLVECKRVMKGDSTLVIHVEPKCSHWIKVCGDELFGEITNEIVWETGGNKNSTKKLQRNHDTLIVYTKGKSIYNPQYTAYSEEAISKARVCPIRGWKYTTSALVNRQPNVVPRPNLRYEWNGHQLQWWVSKEKMQQLHDDHRLQYNSIGIPRVKKYFKETKGVPVKDTWNDIPILQGNEKLDYATQKPISLLERVIKLYTNEGDFVLDPCAGSGTTGRASIKLNRKYTLIDINNEGKTIFEKSISQELPFGL